MVLFSKTYKAHNRLLLVAWQEYVRFSVEFHIDVLIIKIRS